MARSACEEGFDAERFLSKLGSAGEGMSACYVALKSGPDKVTWPGYSLSMSLLTLKDYDISLRHRWNVDRLFRSVLRVCGFYLKLDFEATDLWLAGWSERSWVTRFVMFIGLAAESAKRLKRSERTTWEWFFSELSRIALPEQYEDREDWDILQQ